MKQTLQERLRDFAANKLIDDTISTLDLAEKALEVNVSVMQAITKASEDHVWVKQAAKKQRKRAATALKAIKGVE